jgi:uncharacterized protein YneF (UPF0154 family)
MIMTVLTFKTDVILYIFMTRKSLKKNPPLVKKEAVHKIDTDEIE